MKINVTRAYTDRETRLRVEAGSVLDVPDGRGAELTAKGVAEPVPDKEGGGGGECQQTNGSLTQKHTDRKSK